MNFLNNLISNYFEKTSSKVTEGISSLSESPYIKTASIILSIAGIVYAFYFLIKLINELYLFKRNIHGRK